MGRDEKQGKCEGRDSCAAYVSPVAYAEVPVDCLVAALERTRKHALPVGMVVQGRDSDKLDEAAIPKSTQRKTASVDGSGRQSRACPGRETGNAIGPASMGQAVEAARVQPKKTHST